MILPSDLPAAITCRILRTESFDVLERYNLPMSEARHEIKHSCVELSSSDTKFCLCASVYGPTIDRRRDVDSRLNCIECRPVFFVFGEYTAEVRLCDERFVCSCDPCEPDMPLVVLLPDTRREPALLSDMPGSNDVVSAGGVEGS